jgi:ATP-dependent Clp protease ATP-binding subunit ClpA
MDGAGEKVSLSNTIIIATSNAGSLDIRNAITANEVNFKDKILGDIQNQGTFRPEFLNRFDGLIIFKPLTEAEILQVAQLMIQKVALSYTAKGYEIKISDDLIRRLAKDGYQPELGDRPMQRVIQDKLENYIADRILDGSFQKGGSYTIGPSEIYS